MGRKGELLRSFDHATAELDSVLVRCTGEKAAIRCGPDSKTALAVANHAVDWLEVLAEMLPELPNGAARYLAGDFAEEVDAGLAKAASGRSVVETRSRFRSSAAKMRRALRSIPQGDLDRALPGGFLLGALLKRWACVHIEEHAAEIRAALLATSPAS